MYDASTSQTKCILGQCDSGFVMKYDGTCLSMKILELYVINKTPENNLTRQICVRYSVQLATMATQVKIRIFLKLLY